MSVRSARGLLLTVLAVSTIVALGLGTMSPSGSTRWTQSLGDTAALLYGWRLAVATLALGLGVWLGGVGIEAVAGRRTAQVAAVAMVLSLPCLCWTAEWAYWAPREYASVWRADGGSPTERSGLWRGYIGGECSFGHIVEVRFGADGRGRGRAVHFTGYDNGLTVAIALSPVTGPLTFPIEAVMHDGELRAWSASGPLGTAAVVSP